MGAEGDVLQGHDPDGQAGDGQVEAGLDALGGDVERGRVAEAVERDDVAQGVDERQRPRELDAVPRPEDHVDVGLLARLDGELELVEVQDEERGRADQAQVDGRDRAGDEGGGAPARLGRGLHLHRQAEGGRPDRGVGGVDGREDGVVGRARRPPGDVGRPVQAGGDDVGQQLAPGQLLEEGGGAGRVGQLLLQALGDAHHLHPLRSGQGVEAVDGGDEAAYGAGDSGEVGREVGRAGRVGGEGADVGHERLQGRLEGGGRRPRLGFHRLGRGLQPAGVVDEGGGRVEGLGHERRHLGGVEADRLQQVGELDHPEQLGLDPLEELRRVEHARRPGRADGGGGVAADGPGEAAEGGHVQAGRDQPARAVALAGELHGRLGRQLEEDLGRVVGEAPLAVGGRVAEADGSGLAGEGAHGRHHRLRVVEDGDKAGIVLGHRGGCGQDRDVEGEGVGGDHGVVGLVAAGERQALAVEGHAPLDGARVAVVGDGRLGQARLGGVVEAGVVETPVHEGQGGPELDHVALAVDRHHLEREGRPEHEGDEEEPVVRHAVEVGVVEVGRDPGEDADRLEGHGQVGPPWSGRR